MIVDFPVRIGLIIKRSAGGFGKFSWRGLSSSSGSALTGRTIGAVLSIYDMNTYYLYLFNLISLLLHKRYLYLFLYR